MRISPKLLIPFLLICSPVYAATQLKDEGTAQGYFNVLDCSGAGISCSNSGITATVTVGGGGGASITVQEDDVNVDTAVTTLDFRPGFDVTSSPAGEANIVPDYTEAQVGLTDGVTGILPVANGGTGNSGPNATKTANYTLTSTDNLILADATGGAITMTLPTAVGVTGRIYQIKRINSGANAVTIATTAAQTIDGDTTQVLVVQNVNLSLISDSANWRIL